MVVVFEHDGAVSFRTPSRSKFTLIPTMVTQEEKEFIPTHITIPSNGAYSTTLAPTRQEDEDDGFTTLMKVDGVEEN